MPVSGNDEPRVTARKSSNCSAGVPIKKRKFPMVRPPSPLQQEPSSLPTENDSVENKQSSPSQESSLLNASIATSSPGRSDASKNSFSDVKKEIPDDTNVNSVRNTISLCRPKPQELSPSFYSGSMGYVDSKEKLMLTERSAYQKIPGSTELHSAPNISLAVHVGKEVVSKQQVERDCKLELLTIPGNVELSLGPKEPLFPALSCQNSGGSHTMSDKLDPSSLCLSLSKQKCISQCKSGDVNSYNDSSHVHANRSNWDLNTTMDAWGGAIGDASVPATVGFDGLSKIDGTHDIKPLVSTIGMLGLGADTRKHSLEAGERRSSFLISSLLPSQQYKSEDSIHLSLSTLSCQSTFSGKHSGSSPKIDSGRGVPDSNLCELLVSSGNMNSVGCMTVKSEMRDENAKDGCLGTRDNLVGLLDSSNVKRELVESCTIKPVKLLSTSPPKLVECRSIKSEPIQEDNQETHATEVISNKSVGKVVQCQDNVTSSMAVPLTPQKLRPSGLPTCLELSTSGDISNQSEYYTCTKDVHINAETPLKDCGRVGHVAAEIVSTSVGHKSEESNVSDGMIHPCRAENSNDDREACRLDDLPPDSQGNGEGSESDEEKINISADMLDEDSYGSDYESDGNHAVVAPSCTEDRQYVREDDEYEDGEVRESLVHAAVEGPIGEEREAKNVSLGDYDVKNSESLAFPSDDNAAHAPIDEKDSKIEGHMEISDVPIKECVGVFPNENADQVVHEESSLQESLTIEVAATEADEKRPIKASPRRTVDQSGRKDVQKGHDKEVSSDGATNGGQGTETTVGQVADENIKETDKVEINDSTLPNTEASFNGNDAAKDANSGGNRSRIINLPRASNVTYPCKTRSIQDRSLLSGTSSGRGRYADFEGENLHPRRNRYEIYNDGLRKFGRDRTQDQSLRNSRMNFVRGRGRVSSRLDTLRGEWDSDRNFAPEIYNGQADYRFPRHKRAFAVGDAERECNGYVMAQDGAIVGAGRGGRKPLSDELPSFRHPSSRRISPGGRDGSATRGTPMVRRIPRNISPSRCTGEDGSDLVGLRHSEKFMRGLPDDIIDPKFTRPQPPYERLEGQFGRGNRNFSSGQRRGGLPQIRSKSPIRSGSRSPGPWSSPRRRSPDGFNGIPELSQRSPAIYRMERIRSPDRPCFPEEMVARRRGSPPYMARPSNDLRDMDAGRVHSHPRSVIPNRRSPSDRVLPRSTRRFDNLNPRERTDSDDYFGGPMHSGRFHELSGDGSGDERRQCGERRSFRPPFNAADLDGTRSFRFCPEADSEFIERSNLREREFDRRIKNRPVIAPRRMRNLEEQEGNYRPGGHVWHDDAFDDVSRVKRRRF